MTKKKIRKIAIVNKYQFVLEAKHKEKGGGEINTIPNEAYTIRQLLATHVSGGAYPNHIERAGVYDEEPDIDQQDKLRSPDVDLLDIKEATEIVADTRRRVASDNQKRKKAAEKKAILEEAKSEAQQNENPPEEGAPESEAD